MKTKYLFSSPEGDIEIDEHILNLPLRLSIDKKHSWLRLKDYFDLISSFTTRRLPEYQINTLIVRSEKHGACYHVASIELVDDKKERKKFAVLVGISDSGLHLKREYSLIRMLKERGFRKTYLPEYYLIDEINIRGENICLVLSEWLKGYYEWHITEDGSVCIWDMDNGYFMASPEQRLNIYERAAHILTCYFDPATFSHIYPWHHSAGDFVVRCHKKQVQLRLTSIRDYKAVIMPEFQYDTALIISMVYFFLNMSIKMRLDKKNGIGKVLIAPEDIIPPVIKGFLSGMDELIAKNLLDKEHKDQITGLLSSLSRNELDSLFSSMLDYYGEEDPADIPIISDNMESHINCLYHLLQEGELL